jgi:hypothetical protein
MRGILVTKIIKTVAEWLADNLAVVELGRNIPTTTIHGFITRLKVEIGNMMGNFQSQYNL